MASISERIILDARFGANGMASHGHDDQIAAVFLGTRGGKVQQEKTRARIDWMLAQQKGRSALDIGCSQGILAVLLARQGHHVLGVDVNPRALADAAKLVSEQPDEVASRVRFVEADATQASLPDEVFDTVFVGEVIEHLETPALMIDVAVDHVAADGRLVVTTPHGYMPHDDHKQAFSLSAVLALLPADLSVIELDVQDGYVRLSCERDGKGLRPPTEHMLELAERSLVQQQTLLHRILQSRSQELSRSKAAAERFKNRLDLDTQQLTQARKKLGAREKELKKARDRLRLIETSRSYKVARELAHAVADPVKGIPRLAMKTLRFAAKRVRNGTQIGASADPFKPFEPLKSTSEARLPVVAIMDDFTESCFRHEWDVTLLSRENWRQEISRAEPVFLFVESAWRGNRGTWNYTLTKFVKEPSHPLYDLVMHCRSVGIPTVYWGKEDPPNFDVFSDAASIFDVLFTSDADCIPRYREICGHDRVYALPFAAQPVLHNPAQRNDSPDWQVAFGGGWYNDKHPARQKYLPELIEGTLAASLNLSIFDRFSNLEDKARAKHQFPEKYQKYVNPKLDYDRMLCAYRSFPIFLNVNSVETSPTMFSRRVFELLACGTNIVSSPSSGMSRLLPDLVSIASNAKEASSALKQLDGDPAGARRRAHLGYRTVMREHTYARRAAEVIKRVVPDHAAPVAEPPVTVILSTNRPNRLAHAIENFRRQRYDNKELILALNSDSFDRAATEEAVGGITEVRIFHIPESKTLAACLNHVLRYVDGRYWAKFDDDDVYGDEYLGDAVLPFQFTDAAVVGKASYFARLTGDDTLYMRFPGNEHRYFKRVCGGTLLVDIAATSDITFDESIAKGSDTIFLKKVTAAGLKIYSADPYNFVQVRQIDSKSHTWSISCDDYLKSCVEVGSVADNHLVLI